MTKPQPAMRSGEPALFIGARADDLDRRPIAGSTPEPCAECGTPTMFSPATRARAAEHVSTRYVCLNCAGEKKLLDGLVLFPPDGAQVREVEGEGYDPAAWPLRNQWGKKLQSR